MRKKCTTEALFVFCVKRDYSHIYHLSFEQLFYQRSIATRLLEPRYSDGGLATEFLSLAFFTKGHDTFSIAKVREAYRYCPECEKTTKDYGGKKHLYHSYGTLQRDVWKHPDIQTRWDDDLPRSVVERTRNTLSSGRYESFAAVSSSVFSEYVAEPPTDLSLDTAFPDVKQSQENERTISPGDNTLYCGDAVDLLTQAENQSVDLLFLDPPYNIGKDYNDYDDKRNVTEYYDWCDTWLEECVRVLKSGGVLIALNLPKAVHRYFAYLGQRLTFQNWICWDSMSRPPAGNIMPTNYPILIFSKGDPDGFEYSSLSEVDTTELLRPDQQFKREFIYPLDDTYCKRESCIKRRNRNEVIDRKELTDLWTDVYRLKHNSKREDHPTMLPPKLIRRLLWLYTDEGATVLDPFNGVGTTTLTATQMGRRYTGFEISEKYIEIARQKHEQIRNGIDPFDKSATKIVPPSDNDTTYEVPKRDLQLEIKRLAKELGRIPEREEVAEHGCYSIKYYDEYFQSWIDATKAAKTTGMTEMRTGEGNEQQTLFSYTDGK